MLSSRGQRIGAQAQIGISLVELLVGIAVGLFIVAAASIFGWMLTATGVTLAISEWVLGFTKEPWVFLLLANLLMLFVGCFLEPTAAITILVPILVPICQQLGIDLVWRHEYQRHSRAVHRHGCPSHFRW